MNYMIATWTIDSEGTSPGPGWNPGKFLLNQKYGVHNTNLEAKRAYLAVHAPGHENQSNEKVKVEGIAVALVFRPEALEKWTVISEYTKATDEAEAIILFRVGDRVGCDAAFVGQVGTVRRIGAHCSISVAWVDYGEGRPLYPCSLATLSRVD